MEFLRETERSLTTIKQTEGRLRDQGLLDYDFEKELEHELQMKGTLLGKRARE
jgi:hypothetical protein